MNELTKAFLILSSIGIVLGVLIGYLIGKDEAKYMHVKWVLRDINPFYAIDPAFQRTPFERVFRHFCMAGSISLIIFMIISAITFSKIKKTYDLEIRSDLFVWTPTIIYLIILLIASLISYFYLYPKMETLAQKIREEYVTSNILQDIDNWKNNNEREEWKKWYFSIQSLISDKYGIFLF
jgi:uncharacterized membrane protein